MVIYHNTFFPFCLFGDFFCFVYLFGGFFVFSDFSVAKRCVRTATGLIIFRYKIYFDFLKTVLNLRHMSAWETSRNLLDLIQSHLGIPLKGSHCLLNTLSIRSTESTLYPKTLHDNFSQCYSSRRQLFLACLIFCGCFYSFMWKL